MKSKPSLEEFRSGGSEVAPPKPAPAPAQATPPAPPPPPPAPATVVSQSEHDARARENKTIRLRKAFESRLKSEAYHRSMSEGRRVTESDIIDEALELYFRGR